LAAQERIGCLGHYIRCVFLVASNGSALSFARVDDSSAIWCCCCLCNHALALGWCRMLSNPMRHNCDVFLPSRELTNHSDSLRHQMSHAKHGEKACPQADAKHLHTNSNSQSLQLPARDLVTLDKTTPPTWVEDQRSIKSDCQRHLTGCWTSSAVPMRRRPARVRTS